MTRNKSQILHGKLNELTNPETLEYHHALKIFDAMDEWAEQESIAFAEWLDEEVYNNNLSRVRARNSVHYGKWAYSKGVPNPQFFTTAELFQLLKQSKKC